ncbi:MAG: protein kinase, partial [bacterium]|nr:protein kinase [bacterium]
QTRLTQTGMVIGTINYMAPEQISGAGSSGATDVYSMGVMFYEMLTGVKPFSGETTIDIMKQIIDKDPIEPFKLRFDIPTQLNDAILEMMEKRQDIRPSAGDVLVTMSKIQMRLRE